MSRSIATLVAQSGNEAFQTAACRAAGTDLSNLKDAIHVSACNAICSKLHCLRRCCSIAFVCGQSHGWQWTYNKCMYAEQDGL